VEVFLHNVSIGLATAIEPANLLYCFFGVLLGTAIGVMPGIGALATMSLLVPFTFYVEPTAALVMLAGIYYGSSYGGSTTSILLNLPGQTSATVTCLDGYPMAQQGRAGVALFGAAIASFVGGSLGIILLMVFSPILVAVAREFRQPEYFSLAVMGLVVSSAISPGTLAKGLAMVILGITLGLVGTDLYTGAFRFTFGVVELMDGVSIVALAMGLFGVTEIITSVRTTNVNTMYRRIGFRSMIPTRDDVRRAFLPIIRGSGIGAFFGALPGAGGTISTFVTYAVEKRISKDPSRFGKGAIEGVVAPEAANNAGDQTAFLPTLALGIPGTVNMALILGVMIMHGVQPGPRLMAEQPQLFWGLIMSFWVGNLMLLVLNLPLIGIWVRILTIPYHLLYPAIIMFVCIGVLTERYSPFDVFSVLVLGAVGYGMRLVDFPAAPLLLGFVLGPMMEEHFRRAMIISRGSFRIFVERPLSASFLAATVLMLIWAVWSGGKAARRSEAVAAPRPDVGPGR
jgi:TctA family transporter